MKWLLFLRDIRGFNAARGFVGGASSFSSSMMIASMFQCRTRLCWWCKLESGMKTSPLLCFNAARGFVGGARSLRRSLLLIISGFNAARGFVGGARWLRAVKRCDSMFQCRTRLCWWCKANFFASSCAIAVSMPHAALLVVQVPAFRAST